MIPKCDYCDEEAAVQIKVRPDLATMDLCSQHAEIVAKRLSETRHRREAQEQPGK